MQEFVSIVAWNLLDLVGVPAIRHGYRIELPGENNIMEVADACSGLRSLTAILGMASPWLISSDAARGIASRLVAMAAPVAIGVNCFRVFITGLIMVYAGKQWASGDLHDWEGIVMILLAAGLLLLIAWLLAKFDGWYNEPQPVAEAAARRIPRRSPLDAEREVSNIASLPFPTLIQTNMKLINRFVIVMIVCVLGLIVQSAVFAYLDKGSLAPGKPTTKLELFPKELGDWVGQDYPLETPYDFADDSLRRAFINRKTRQQLLLWMVYSDCGEDREHNPVVCHGVAGEVEDLSARKPIEVPGHKAPVQQYRFGHDDKHTLVYHWYYTLPSPEKKKLSDLQRVYSEIRRPPASMTIENFVPEMGLNDAQGAIEICEARRCGCPVVRRSDGDSRQHAAAGQSRRPQRH